MEEDISGEGESEAIAAYFDFDQAMIVRKMMVAASIDKHYWLQPIWLKEQDG
jgi:hypothetical protein